MSGDALLVQLCELRAATDVCAALAVLQLDHLAVDDARVVVLFWEAVLNRRGETGMLTAA